MSILSIIVVLVVAGFLVYLANTLIPMDPKFRTALNAIVGLLLFLWILSAFFPGLLGDTSFSGCNRPVVVHTR